MKRPRCIRAVRLAALLLAVTACEDDPVRPELPRRAPVARNAALTAGAHLTRNVYFLPPVGTAVEPVGRFDATLLPALALEVCETDGQGCTQTVARFTAQGTGAQRLRLEEEEGQQHYHANWRVDGNAAGKRYRLRVLLDGLELAATELGVVGKRTLPLKVWIGRPGLAGDPDAPTSELPRSAFVPRADDYSTTHPELPGVPLSHSVLMVALTRDATLGDVSALIEELGAELAGSIPGEAGASGGIVFLRLPTSSHAEMESALARVRNNPRVAAAAQDILLQGQALPPHRPNAATGWTWERATSAHRSPTRAAMSRRPGWRS